MCIHFSSARKGWTEIKWNEGKQDTVDIDEINKRQKGIDSTWRNEQRAGTISSATRRLFPAYIDRLIENIRLPGMQSDEHLSAVWRGWPCNMFSRRINHSRTINFHETPFVPTASTILMEGPVKARGYFRPRSTNNPDRYSRPRWRSSFIVRDNPAK